MKTCSRCGLENPDCSYACQNCFAQLDPVPAAVRKPAKEERPANRLVAKREQAVPRSRKGVPWKMLIPLVLIAAACGFAVWSFILKPTPQKAVTAFFDAISEGKYVAAAEMMTSESRTLLPIEQAAGGQAAQRIAQWMPKLKDLKFGEVTISDTDASVQVTATVEMKNPFGGNQLSNTNTQTFFLLKEEGVWKIDMVRQVREQLAQVPKEQLAKMRPFVAMGGTQAAGILRLIDEILGSK